MFLVVASVIVLLTHISAAIRGFNTTQPITPVNADCMRANGYDFFIARLMDNGVVNEIGLQNVQNAKACRK